MNVLLSCRHPPLSRAGLLAAIGEAFAAVGAAFTSFLAHEAAAERRETCF